MLSPPSEFVDSTIIQARASILKNKELLCYTTHVKNNSSKSESLHPKCSDLTFPGFLDRTNYTTMVDSKCTGTPTPVESVALGQESVVEMQTLNNDFIVIAHSSKKRGERNYGGL